MISSEVRLSRLPGRLVGKDERGLRHQAPGDRHALLLPARELRREVRGPAFEPDQPQRLERARVALGAARLAVDQRDLDVLERGRARQQVEALEDEADLAVADLGEAVARERRDIRAVEDERPRRGRSRQPAMFMNVDLPEPDGPRSATNSPGSTRTDTPRSARTSVSPMT
jgi:hypothetical protein